MIELNWAGEGNGLLFSGCRSEDSAEFLTYLVSSVTTGGGGTVGTNTGVFTLITPAISDAEGLYCSKGSSVPLYSHLLCKQHL